MNLGELYTVVCCILLCVEFSLNVELHPSSDFVEVCLGNTVEVNCTTETNHLLWSTSPECRVPYNKQGTETVGVVRPFCDFEAVLLSLSPSLMSTATLSNANSSHNGTVLTCADTTVQLNIKADQMASISIVVRGPPSAPLSPSFTPQSLSSVVLSWTQSDADCVVKYTIVLINITEGNASYIYNTTTNTTSMTVSDLTQGADYLFTVAGIDGEGRVGEYSASSEILTLDVPDAVLGLNASVAHHNQAVIITWMPPPPSSRPPVIAYKIYHNNTQFGNLTTTVISDSGYNVEDASPGVYQFTVVAYNVLGDGNESTIFVTVTASVSPSVSSGSTESTSTTSDTHGSSVNMNPTSSTPAATMKPTPITTLLIIVVGVILVLLLIVMLISGILAGKLYCSRSKRVRSKEGDLAEDDQGRSSPPYLTATSSEELKSTGTLHVCSEYSVVTTQFGGERKMSPAPVEDDHTYSKLNRPSYKPPPNDGEYSEVRLTGQKEPTTLPSTVRVPPEPFQNPLPLPAKPSHRGIQYVELGQRDVNAPPILPPDVAVNYMQLRSNQERPTAPGHTSNGYGSKSPSKRPPPLPPRD